MVDRGEGVANSLITRNLTSEKAVKMRGFIVQRVDALRLMHEERRMGREGCDVIITDLYAAA
jgi:hypothetical protein